MFRRWVPQNLQLRLLLAMVLCITIVLMAVTAVSIGAGEWVSPEGQDRKDEFGMLARSFGQMVGALRARGDELRDQVQAIQTLNAELARRVAERTSELNDLVAGQELLLSQIRQMSTP